MSEDNVFLAIVDYGLARDVTNIKDLPGCWESQVDDQWWFALNPHKEPMECSRKTTVPPITAYLEFNGWPAGLFDPDGGCIAAGDIANRDTFLAALQIDQTEIPPSKVTGQGG